MANPLNRRLAVLEEVARVDVPRVLVWNARGGGNHQAWRIEHVAPLEARGYRRLGVVLRDSWAELTHLVVSLIL